MDSKFTVSEAFKTSWKGLKEQIWVMAGLVVAYAILNGVLSMLMAPMQSSLIGGIIYTLIMLVVSVIFYLGYYKNCFQTLDGDEPQFSAYGSQFGKLFTYVIADILYAVIVLVGCCLLIVPGIYLAIRLQFFTCLIVEDNAGIIESLKKSWEITDGQVGSLLKFLLAVIGIGILGFICFGIGLFIAIPLIYIMQCYIFRKLSMVDLVQES